MHILIMQHKIKRMTKIWEDMTHIILFIWSIWVWDKGNFLIYLGWILGFLGFSNSVYETWNSDYLNSSDCRAWKLISNDFKLEPISWELNLKNQLFNFCVGFWVGGHLRANFSCIRFSYIILSIWSIWLWNKGSFLIYLESNADWSWRLIIADVVTDKMKFW